MIRNTRLRHWLLFITGGALNTFVTYGLYLTLQLLLFYQVAYAIAYVVGIVFSYWYNSVIVFRAALSAKGLFTYPLVYLVQYLASALFLGFLIERVGISAGAAPLLVASLMIPLTFFMSRWILRSSS